MVCKICPHQCGADRVAHVGICRAPNQLKVALASLHHFEEPVISGNRGSGTIFFSNCNLACVFCQNYDISQEYQGRVITSDRLADIATELKAQGAHNLNLVSPTPYSEMILSALMPVKYGLDIPIVWNSNGYELVSEVERMESLVDVYLPDLKFFDAAVAKRYCGAADYFKYASKAVGEMWRQKRECKVQSADSILLGRSLTTKGLGPESRNVTTKTPRHQEEKGRVPNPGESTTNTTKDTNGPESGESTTKTPRHQVKMDSESGELATKDTNIIKGASEAETEASGRTTIMTQGVIIRHLVLPGQAEDSKKILKWIADNIGTDVYISLMAQYTPVHKANRFPEINRRLGKKEYASVCDYFYKLGFENGWVQELTAASSEYTPEFNLKGV